MAPPPASNFDKTLKWISMVTLLVAGAVMIYEGSTYIKAKHSNPSIPDKIYAAAVLAIVLGVAEIAYGIYHFWLD